MSWLELASYWHEIQTPGGIGTSTNGQVLFNSSGSVAGDAGLTYDAGTDTLTTGRVLVGDGSRAAPAVSFASHPGTGMWFREVTGLDFSVNDSFAFGMFDGGFRFGTNLAVFATAPASDTFQHGNKPSTAPTAQTLIVGESGAGTDIPGANGVIQSGAGTGAGAGSTLEFRTPNAHGTDAVAQTYVSRLTLSQATNATFKLSVYNDSNDTYQIGNDTNAWRSLYLSRATLGSKSKTLTDATPTAFATIALADGGETGGKLIYRVVATDGGTARQVVSGSLNYSAVHVGATYAVDYDEVQQSTSVSSGTLTGAVTAAGASNLLTFSANFDTDLGTPVLTIYYRFDSTNAADVIAPL